MADATIVIADGTYGDRLFLELAIDEHPRMSLVGQATNGRTAAEVCERLQPSAVIVDRQLPVIEARELIPLLRVMCPATKIILWTDLASAEAQRDSHSLGAHAQITKDAGAAEIVRMVEHLISVPPSRSADTILANLRFPRRHALASEWAPQTL